MVGFSSLLPHRDDGSNRDASPTPPCEDEEAELIHGTLFVCIRAATMLGRSRVALATNTESNVAEKPPKVVQGARFVGKKMLNAVRATNQVPFPVARCLGDIVISKVSRSHRSSIRLISLKTSNMVAVTEANFRRSATSSWTLLATELCL